jgi:hypothetical protein
MITWGQLAKSQTDPEKIEEAIKRLIDEHNADPEAHLVEGGSLKSHKMSEIIDHLVESIVLDKLARFSVDWSKIVGDQFLFQSCFDSVDGWERDMEGAGDIILNTFCLIVKTGAVSGNWTYLIAGEPYDPSFCNFTKRMVFQTTFYVPYTTYQYILALCGDNWNGIGFSIENNRLYCDWFKDGEEIQHDITGIDFTKKHVYRMEFDPDQMKAYFFIDGQLVYVATEDLPTGNADTSIFYYVKTFTNASRQIRLVDVFWSRKK